MTCIAASLQLSEEMDIVEFEEHMWQDSTPRGGTSPDNAYSEEVVGESSASSPCDSSGKAEMDSSYEGGVQCRIGDEIVDDVQGKSIKGLGLGEHAFDPSPLPEDWVAVEHTSGGIVYLHKRTRVCTWSRPYHVSHSEAIKKHRVPVQSIPCLEKWLFNNVQTAVTKRWHQDASSRKGKLIKLESHRLREYLLLRWDKEDLDNVVKTERFGLAKDAQKRAEQPKKEVESVLPAGISKVLRIPIPKEYLDGKKPAVWLVNTSKKSSVSLLYEFCQNYLKVTPEFVAEEINSKNTPYTCTVTICGMKYGYGAALTKKQSKHTAAQETLSLFLPGVFKNTSTSAPPKQELQYFVSVPIDDPQAPELLNQAGFPSPWQILKICLQRNQGMLPLGELQFTLSPSPSSGEKSHFIYYLSCGEKYVASGACTSKRDGQQLGAQALLKKLHPYITNWDALLQIYADKSWSEAKEESPSEVPSVAGGENTDYAMLKMLQVEMHKLASDAKGREFSQYEELQKFTSQAHQKHLQTFT